MATHGSALAEHFYISSFLWVPCQGAVLELSEGARGSVGISGLLWVGRGWLRWSQHRDFKDFFTEQSPKPWVWTAKFSVSWVQVP